MLGGMAELAGNTGSVTEGWERGTEAGGVCPG